MNVQQGGHFAALEQIVLKLENEVDSSLKQASWKKGK